MLRKQTLMASLSALGLIAAILIICAIFFVIGISRSAESNRIFELVTYQQTVAEKLAKQVESLGGIKGEHSYLNELKRLQKTVDEAKYIQQHITMPNTWGPMDAYNVEVLRAAYQDEPLLIDQRFNEMIAAYDKLLIEARNKPYVAILEKTDVQSKTESFIHSQGKVTKVYLARIDAVLDQSRWRISLTFLCMFLSLAAIGVFLLRPFARHVESQAKAVEQTNRKLQIAALSDPLTGLPNRLAVIDHLNRELELAQKHNRQLAVAHIDIDHFKEINDKYGHAAGDFMLIEIAARMREWENSCNFIARFGGDEFVAVMSCDASPFTFESRAQELLSLIAKMMDFDGITLLSTASIGVSVYPSDSQNGRELIVNSDLALYEAKQSGRGCARFFKPSMREALNVRKTLEADLIAALDKGHIRPFFQPQVNIVNNRIVGVEALVRWHHETRGPMSPAEFLHVAESSGLMVRLGRHIMEKSIIEASKWQAMNIPFGRLALNASASELHEADFVDWVLATAMKHELPTSLLSIEILETVIMKDARYKLSDKLARLRRAGIHIELDDFGTGYASLQQVRADEIDRLKIDRSFITNLNDERCNFVIVSSIIEMAKKLNIAVVAEGVETMAELETLLSLGCHTVQGFGVALPMPAQAALEWMKLFAPFNYEAQAHSKIELAANKLSVAS